VHELLLCKLQNAQNYSVSAGMLVRSYLGEQTYSTVCEIWWSRIFCWAVTYGVRQGSVLGPLLFISYIDDVSRVIRYCRFHIYADDRVGLLKVY
jgi:hypothetical protein